MTKKEWDKTSQEEDDVQVNFVLVRSEEEEDQIKEKTEKMRKEVFRSDEEGKGNKEGRRK